MKTVRSKGIHWPN